MSAYKDAQANNDITRNVKQYRDLDLFFSKKTNKDLNKVTDIEAVKRSVRNLILTNTFEKPFHPEIGSNIRRTLFETLSPITAVMLSEQIENVIRTYEPRVELHRVDSIPNLDRNAYDVRIEFFIVNASAELVALDVLLERVRW